LAPNPETLWGTHYRESRQYLCIVANKKPFY
jgi:hypothetical protein